MQLTAKSDSVIIIPEVSRKSSMKLQNLRKSGELLLSALRVSAFRKQDCPRHDPQRHPICECSFPPAFSWDPCRRAASCPQLHRPSFLRRYRPKIQYTFSYLSLLCGLGIVCPRLQRKTAPDAFAKK